jgi:MerR family redox-sensitive transcriptional activator SoxR
MEGSRQFKTSSKLEVKASIAMAPPPSSTVPHTLSVGEVARRSGVSVSALHFYEQKGLIASKRTAGNQRRYARDVLRRVAVIRGGQQVGISLGELQRALATLPASKAPTRADWKRLSIRWRADLEVRMAQLGRLRDTLDDCIGCGCLSIDRCGLRNLGDKLAAEGPGAVRLRVKKEGEAPV